MVNVASIYALGLAGTQIIVSVTSYMNRAGPKLIIKNDLLLACFLEKSL